MEHQNSREIKSKTEENTQPVKNVSKGDNAGSFANSSLQGKTPWAHDEQRYANLVNLGGDLKKYGWILFGVAWAIGLIFLFVGFSADSFGQKILGIAVGVGLMLVGAIVKIVWHALSELLTLFIDVANDLHRLKLK